MYAKHFKWYIRLYLSLSRVPRLMDVIRPPKPPFGRLTYSIRGLMTWNGSFGPRLVSFFNNLLIEIIYTTINYLNIVLRIFLNYNLHMTTSAIQHRSTLKLFTDCK